MAEINVCGGSTADLCHCFLLVLPRCRFMIPQASPTVAPEGLLAEVKFITADERTEDNPTRLAVDEKVGQKWQKNGPLHCRIPLPTPHE